MLDGIALLRGDGNADQPVSIADLGVPSLWRWSEKRDWIRNGLLIFMVENQAVCLWALRLDSEDDPPVVVARDPDLVWRSCAGSFSTFIACMMWDHSKIWPRGAGDGHGLLLQAQDIPLRSADLQLLRERFNEQPTTQGWPAQNQYRFERDDAAILIWDDEDQADWWVATETEEHLVRLLNELWSCGGLSTSLWSADEDGERILARFRNSARGA